MDHKGFVLFHPSAKLCTTLDLEARAQEALRRRRTSLQAGRVGISWLSTPTARHRVQEVLDEVRPLDPTFFTGGMIVVGVQDIQVGESAQTQGYHRDVESIEDALTIAIDTSGHALGTDIVVADSENLPALDEWVLQNNLARPSAVNRPRRRCRSAAPSIPREHRVERVDRNGVVFNPFSYHRGTSDAGPGHRVFIHLGRPGSQSTIADSNNIKCKWNLPIRPRGGTAGQAGTQA